MNNKPFDLQKALAGEPVVTRCGLKVLDIYHFKRSGSLHPVLATVEGSNCEECYTVNGEYSKACATHSMDLFMAPKPVEYWVATGLFIDDHDSMFSTNPCVTESVAREDLVNNCDILNATIQTHKITRYE